MAAPMEGKVGHVGEQPTMASFNGELGSVSRISIETRIGQINTLEYTKYSENVRRSRDDYDTFREKAKPVRRPVVAETHRKA